MICQIFHQTSSKTVYFNPYSCQRGSSVLQLLLKKRTELNVAQYNNILEMLNARLLSEYNSIKTYACSALPIERTIPDTQLKFLLKSIRYHCYSRTNRPLIEHYCLCYHEFVDRNSVFICSMRTDLFTVSWFSFRLSITPEII